MMISKNDYLVEQIINDTNYIIKETGEITTRITTSGKISKKNIWRNCIQIDQYKYQCVNYKYKKLQVHRIVYRKFAGSIDSRLMINHIDGNPSNNRIENLELVTCSKNNEHRYRTLKRDPVMGNKKISKEIADQIREEYKKGTKYRTICSIYSLSMSTVSYIINNKTWK